MTISSADCYTRSDEPTRAQQLEVRCSEGMSSRNRKGCDIGYALATSSCEGANSVDARTVTALDVTAAFAVPDPGGFLAKPSVFSGPDARQIASPCGSLSLLRFSYGL